MMQNVGWGGSELHTLELARALRARGHAVTLVELGLEVFAQHPMPRELGVQVVRIHLGKPPERVTFGEWRRAFRTLECDVAVFSKASVLAGSAALDLAARLTFSRYVTIEHLTPPAMPPKSRKRYLGVLPGLWWWRRMLFHQGPPVYIRSIGPQRIVGVSYAVTEELRRYAFPRRKLRPIPNGIDADRYRPDPAQRMATRTAWGIPHEAFVFGTVARLELSHKGQDIAIALFARLVAANPGRDLRYVLVGDGPHRPALERQIEVLGLAGRVLLIGNTDRPWEAYPALDAFLMPSHFEGIGLALLEAMATEVVPIAFGVGGVRDVIYGPAVGCQVRPGDREGLYQAMQAALDQSDRAREAIGRRCRAHVLERYRASEQYRKIVALIEGGCMVSTKLDAAATSPPSMLEHGRAPRRVCVLSCPTGWGGCELYTLGLARTLAERGHAVTLVELGEPFFAKHAGLPPGVRLVTVQFDMPPAEVAFSRWIRILRSVHCDACVFVKAQVHSGNLALDLAARICFGRYIIVEQVSPPKPPPTRSRRHLGFVPGIGLWRMPFIWKLYRRSLGPQRIVAVSRTLVRELREYWYPRHKLVTIANGIDTDLCHPNPLHRAASRAAWRVPPDAIVFGTVGRLLVSHKGQDIAIDAFARLRAANPDRDPWYVLVGDGPDRSQLEAQAREAGVAHRVVFAGYTERPWESHCGVDVFVLSSTAEGTPLALLEAMSCSVCPIAMDVGGVADVIATPNLGWRVAAGDRADLLAAMQAALLQTPDERAAMGARAREHVEHGFRAQEQFGKVAALLEK